MVDRTEDYTRRLEEQTVELARAHDQTRTFCGIVQEIGALRSLNDIGFFLIKRFQKILRCTHLTLLVFNSNCDVLFVLSENSANVLTQPEVNRAILGDLEGLTEVTFTKKLAFKPPFDPGFFQEAARQAIVPLQYENQLLGALVIACPGDCRCNVKEVDLVGLILSQAAGVINRAVLQEEDATKFQNKISESAEFSGMIGKNPKMQVVYKLIEDIAPTDATVLIQGESGTGKELVARAIHQLSSRQEKPFVVINCSAYPATLIESEIFGHEKGAFTGAIRQKQGRFEQADGGTVFLDEIGEISPSAQIKLLRVLQTQKFERLGGEETLAVDVRILAATNKDLLQEVKNGHFREDLYYRLNVIPIDLPPLKDRLNDIPLLARHFLRWFSAEQGKKIEDFKPEAMRLVLDYPWPGNVRELENCIEHAVVLAKSARIEVTDLPSVLYIESAHASVASKGTLMETERQHLQEALEACSWNKKRTAQRLGISRSTLYDKLRKHQITRPSTH